MSDFIENKLKTMSVKELENIIAKALMDATGEEIDVTISSISYGHNLLTGAKFEVSASRPIKFGKEDA